MCQMRSAPAAVNRTRNAGSVTARGTAVRVAGKTTCPDTLTSFTPRCSFSPTIMYNRSLEVPEFPLDQLRCHVIEQLEDAVMACRNNYKEILGASQEFVFV